MIPTQFSAETIKALEDAITRKSTGKSVLEYEVGGRKTKFDTMTLDEMTGLLRTMRQAVNQQAVAEGVAPARRRYSLLTTGKGL